MDYVKCIKNVEMLLSIKRDLSMKLCILKSVFVGFLADFVQSIIEKQQADAKDVKLSQE